MNLTTPALVVLIGPSSAGKSTWAATHFEPNEVVSSDALRGAVGAGEDDLTASPAAFEILDRIVAERVRRGMTTVVDSLGFDGEARKRWASWAAEADLPVHLVAFETEPSICETRNDTRERPIPKAVLRKQFQRFREVSESLHEPLVVRTGADMGHIRSDEPRVAQKKGEVGHSFGLIVSRFNWGDGDLGDQLSSIAERAEASGFRDLWVMDHFRQIPQVGRAWEDIPEAYAALAHMAAATNEIRLGALVTGITHRHPVVLGKTIATLDVLSGGRAICGLGIAWDEDEHSSYGIEFPSTAIRYEILEETLQMLPLLWGKGSPDFHGQHISAENLVCYPRPIQDPIPTLIGGSGEKRTLRLVAQYADAANVFGNPEAIRHKADVVARHCEDFERDPAEVEITHLTNTLVADNRKALMASANRLRARNQTAEEFISLNRGGTTDQLVERFSDYHEAGASHSIVSMPDVADTGSIEAFGDVIARFAGS